MYRNLRKYDDNALEIKRKNIESDIESLKDALRFIPETSVLGYMSVSATLNRKRKQLAEIKEEQEYRIFKERYKGE